MADVDPVEKEVSPRPAGPRPRTTRQAPHSQRDRRPAALLIRPLVERASALDGVMVSGSRRAPPGTIGLHLPAAATKNDERAFLTDREFAHVHPHEDGSLHLILPEPLRSEAIDAGWAEPRPLAGHPTVSLDAPSWFMRPATRRSLRP